MRLIQLIAETFKWIPHFFIYKYLKFHPEHFEIGTIIKKLKQKKKLKISINPDLLFM